MPQRSMMPLRTRMAEASRSGWKSSGDMDADSQRCVCTNGRETSSSVLIRLRHRSARAAIPQRPAVIAAFARRNNAKA